MAFLFVPGMLRMKYRATCSVMG